MTPPSEHTAVPLHPSGHIDGFARAQLPPVEQWPVITLEGVYAVPPRLNTAVELLDRAIEEGHGDRVAIVVPDGLGGWEETTYAQLAVQVDALAHVLVNDLGLVSGNRVLCRGYNGRFMTVAWLATLKAGMVAVTTMPMLRAGELRMVIERAQCNAALCDARLLEDLETATAGTPSVRAVRCWGGDDADDLQHAMARHTAPFTASSTSSDDVALIAFTSGTTGIPKGCMHFHRDVMAMCRGFSAQVLGITANDRCIGTPPIAFTFGLGGLVCFPMAARASVVLLERASPESLLDAIAATRATVSFTAPTFYRHMSIAIREHPARFDTASLRVTVSAGEALPDATRTLWREATGLEMLDGIGATELIHVFIGAAGKDWRRGAIGRAVPGYTIAILDDALREVPRGEVGRLAVRGPTGCRYLADARQSSYVQGGWNLTGDACTMDDDGYVFFKARTDDLIVSAGYNIGAPEVEGALLQHEAVAECAVVGLPDDERGQVVTAFVVLRSGIDGDSALVRVLQEHVKATIAPYKYPRQVQFVSALPKTDTGKLQRFRLKESS
ncbi:AMP-binding protein [Gemmatimonas groenlandica]|uniref:AMP-binding protein n=1 Tax=Gemmatimonas groenlandica TaxID=2732249 RepID=UPI0019808D47|nr:AMP-binding protein [Gemmatimonas groenlandica]